MTEKQIKSRIVHKHDIAEHWALATGFTPKQGELIIYDDRYTDVDGNEVIVADRVRCKIGDGAANINDLPFIDDAVLETASAQDIVIFHEAQAYTDAALINKADAYDDALTTTDKTIVGAINELNEKALPTYDTTADEGKFLRIVNGAPAWVTIEDGDEVEY